MKRKIYVILNGTILYSILFILITNALITDQVRTTYGYCVQNDIALRIYGPSWTGCKDECTLRSDCTAIRYYARMKRCQLNNDSVTMDIVKCPGVVHAERGYWIEVTIFLYLKVFPSTDCPYRGVKVACFGIKSVKVLIREFSIFAIKALQNNAYKVTGK